MITKEEIRKIAFQSQLDSSQIEKDYVLGWLLASISQHPVLSTAWIFKGGTCLRKIYFANYRYSEDLDFTVSRDVVLSAQESHRYIQDICEWVTKKSGIEINRDRFTFEELHNDADQNIFQCKLYYCGPTSPRAPRQWPRIKFDITADEVVVTPAQKHPIIHPYSDFQKLADCQVNTYSMYDLFSEKLRALFERTRPRDLYDVVKIFQFIGKNIDIFKMKECIRIKCIFKKIEILALNNLKLDSCEAAWTDQLAHQIHQLKAFEHYYDIFKHIFKEMDLDQLFDPKVSAQTNQTKSL